MGVVCSTLPAWATVLQIGWLIPVSVIHGFNRFPMGQLATHVLNVTKFSAYHLIQFASFSYLWSGGGSLAKVWLDSSSWPQLTATPLSQRPKCWDYNRGTPCAAHIYVLKRDWFWFCFSCVLIWLRVKVIPASQNKSASLLPSCPLLQFFDMN